jgi:hypothetical protein
MHSDRRGYVYESFRQGGRVCRRYVGSGELFGALIECQSGRELEERLKRLDERDECAGFGVGSDELKALGAASNALFRASMNAGGFHRHKRGVWRKRRQKNDTQGTDEMAQTKPQKSTELSKIEALSPEQNARFALLKRAQGDKGAALEAIEKFKGTPEEGAALEVLASISEVAREGLLSNLTDSELRKAGFRRQLELMRDDLAGPNPTRLELHLAERVALCALAVARLEGLFIHNVDSSPKVWEVCGRQLDGAHRRHLDAVKALASVRKLQLPNVQVNISEKQVNIANVNHDDARRVVRE